MSSYSAELWKILDTFQDYMKDGYAKSHPDPPVAARHFNSAHGPAGGQAVRHSADDASRKQALEALEQEIEHCTRCRLSQNRRSAVPGMGVLDPRVMLIGEGPGAEEDASGTPFVGPAGKYLDKWLAAIDLRRDTECFIANIVKCRPPNNRNPESDEADACKEFLDRQIGIIKPKTILTLGRVAAGRMIGSDDGIGRLRGEVYRYKGIPLVPTYHPSGVLRNPEYRAAVWEDLKTLRRLFR